MGERPWSSVGEASTPSRFKRKQMLKDATVFIALRFCGRPTTDDERRLTKSTFHNSIAAGILVEFARTSKEWTH